MSERMRKIGVRLDAMVTSQREERDALQADFIDRCGPSLGRAAYEYAISVPTTREAIASERVIFAEAFTQALDDQSSGEQRTAAMGAILEASESRGISIYKRFESTTLPYGAKILDVELPLGESDDTTTH